MLRRLIALAIFFAITAAIHAEYYLIRVDLTKPLDKATNKLVDFQCREVEGEKKTIQSVTLDSINPYLSL